MSDDWGWRWTLTDMRGKLWWLPDCLYLSRTLDEERETERERERGRECWTFASVVNVCTDDECDLTFTACICDFVWKFVDTTNYIYIYIFASTYVWYFLSVWRLNLTETSQFSQKKRRWPCFSTSSTFRKFSFLFRPKASQRSYAGLEVTVRLRLAPTLWRFSSLVVFHHLSVLWPVTDNALRERERESGGFSTEKQQMLQNMFTTGQCWVLQTTTTSAAEAAAAFDATASPPRWTSLHCTKCCVCWETTLREMDPHLEVWLRRSYRRPNESLNERNRNGFSRGR